MPTSQINTFSSQKLTHQEAIIALNGLTSLNISLRFVKEMTANKQLPDDVRCYIFDMLDSYINANASNLYLLKKYFRGILE